MKNTFKKAMASVMAVTTMAVSAVNINTSAYWTTKSFGVNGEAYNYTDSGTVYGTTNTGISNGYRRVDITHVNGIPIIGYYNWSTSAKVSVRYNGSNITSGRTEHKEGTSSSNITGTTHIVMNP